MAGGGIESFLLTYHHPFVLLFQLQRHGTRHPNLLSTTGLDRIQLHLCDRNISKCKYSLHRPTALYTLIQHNYSITAVLNFGFTLVFECLVLDYNTNTFGYSTFRKLLYMKYSNRNQNLYCFLPLKWQKGLVVWSVSVFPSTARSPHVAELSSQLLWLVGFPAAFDCKT